MVQGPWRSGGCGSEGATTAGGGKLWLGGGVVRRASGRAGGPIMGRERVGMCRPSDRNPTNLTCAIKYLAACGVGKTVMARCGVGKTVMARSMCSMGPSVEARECA